MVAKPLVMVLAVCPLKGLLLYTFPFTEVMDGGVAFINAIKLSYFIHTTFLVVLSVFASQAR